MGSSNKIKTKTKRRKGIYLAPKIEVEKVRIPVWAGSSSCLDTNTSISTPDGNVKVCDLTIGQLVWSLSYEFKKIAVPVVKTSSREAGINHFMIHLSLRDGRQLSISPLHPTIYGEPVSTLKIGDIYDGSIVVKNNLEIYDSMRTYDLLPAGDTGLYWANDILIGSTLFNSAKTEVMGEHYQFL